MWRSRPWMPCLPSMVDDRRFSSRANQVPQDVNGLVGYGWPIIHAGGKMKAALSPILRGLSGSGIGRASGRFLDPDDF